MRSLRHDAHACQLHGQTCHRQLCRDVASADAISLLRKRNRNGLWAGKENEESLAIYHNEVKMITRGEGRSTCAASAYISCSAIYNDYDGIQHDYTRKGGLIWEHVFLPPMAPAAWRDRETLWNAVEAAEKEKDNRLGREHVVALPIELDKRDWIALLSDYILTQFVEEGMCVDAAIHDPDGHNPHAHIITTVRPLNEDGTWQYKTEKEYLCVRDGEERGFTAAEFKEAKNEGWEKQYPYKVGKKKVYMTPSAAEAQGYERANKYPKSTKFGRQNPIAAKWNSEEQLLKWREAWAETVNRHLEHSGHDERIDHRSFADQGKDEQPTIHEGVAARIVEKKGGISERCEINRQIREDNRLLRELKALVSRLTEAAKDAITTLARKLETIRANMIGSFYALRHNSQRRSEAQEYLEWALPLFSRYTEIHTGIKEKSASLRRLQKEKDALSVVSILKRRELNTQIEALETEIGKLRKKGKAIMQKCGKTDHAGMLEIQNEIATRRATIQHVDERKPVIQDSLAKSKRFFLNLRKSAEEYAPELLEKERLALRTETENKMRAEIEQKTGLPIQDTPYKESAAEADNALIPPEPKSKKQQDRTKRQKHERKQETR